MAPRFMSSDRAMSPDGGAVRDMSLDGGGVVVFDFDPEEQADKTRTSERPPITVFMQ